MADGPPGTAAVNPVGLVTRSSLYGFDETRDRLLEAIASHSLTVFAQIDHAAAAAAIGMILRPTVVVIFGNPAAGTVLMKIAQTIGIDLPLKAMIWEDKGGETWLSHDDVAWLADRHDVVVEANATVDTMIHALAVVVRHATGAAK